MTYYVPGTEETDLKKVIMSLQQTAGNTATNTTNIATNTTNIATNTAAITALQTAGQGLVNSGGSLAVSLSKITATLGANVTLNNTGTFFDGPSIAQGTTGTWFVSGTVTCLDTAGAARFDAKLWDGTTVIATASATSAAASPAVGVSFAAAISLSGFITSPVGNLRISVRDASSTNGLIRAVSSGIGGADITAFRIA